MSLVSLVKWDVSLGSADVRWGGVRAIRTAAKETIGVSDEGPKIYYWNKRGVLRRHCSDTNRHTKRLVYCFSHLIGLFSVTWLFLLYKFTRFFIYFMLLSDEGSTLETLVFTIRNISAVHQPLYWFIIEFEKCGFHNLYFPVFSLAFQVSIKHTW